MTITKITVSSTKPTLMAIYVDDLFLTNLPRQVIEKNNIRVSQKLSSDDFKSLEQLGLEEQYYDKVLKYLMIRLRSSFEVVSYLEKKAVPSDIINKIINRLIEENLLDDFKFTQAFINDRIKLKPSSSLKIIYELKAKGIGSDIINDLVNRSEIDDKALTVLIIKKRKIPRYLDDKKLISYLMAQGFSYSNILEHLK